MFGDSSVISEVSEIRTVQSNKRLKKTRKAIIVRETSERPPKTLVARTFNLLSFVAIGLVAVFLGMFIGNMVIAGKTLVNYDYDEALFIADYVGVYNKNKNSNPNNVKAYDAYAMAEYQLMHDSGLIDNFKITGDGYVTAKVSGMVQNQVIVKNILKTPDKIYNDSITQGLIPAAEKLIYSYKDNKISSYVSKKISGTPPSASYDDKPKAEYVLPKDLDAYRAEYGISPYVIFPYLVSSKTVDSFSESPEAVEGGYSYKLSLNKVYSVINYVQLMVHISGLTRPPTFYEISIDFVVDQNFRFTYLHVYERYQIYYMGLPADCISETTYKFDYK